MGRAGGRALAIPKSSCRQARERRKFPPTKMAILQTDRSSEAKSNVYGGRQEATDIKVKLP
jgi:hypothetical protein